MVSHLQWCLPGLFGSSWSFKLHYRSSDVQGLWPSLWGVSWKLLSDWPGVYIWQSCSAHPLPTIKKTKKHAQGIYSKEAKKFGFKMNWTKNKCMHVADGPDPSPLRVGNDFIEPVKKFAYWGSIVTVKSGLKPEITSRRCTGSISSAVY